MCSASQDLHEKKNSNLQNMSAKIGLTKSWNLAFETAQYVFQNITNSRNLTFFWAGISFGQVCALVFSTLLGNTIFAKVADGIVILFSLFFSGREFRKSKTDKTYNKADDCVENSQAMVSGIDTSVKNAFDLRIPHYLSDVDVQQLEIFADLRIFQHGRTYGYPVQRCVRGDRHWVIEGKSKDAIAQLKTLYDGIVHELEQKLEAMMDTGDNENQPLDHFNSGDLTNGQQNKTPYQSANSKTNKSDIAKEEKQESKRFLDRDRRKTESAEIDDKKTEKMSPNMHMSSTTRVRRFTAPSS